MYSTERLDDMSPGGFLRLMLDDDGDIIVTVAQCYDSGVISRVASVEFCAVGSGGGKSPRLRRALIDLMGAMAEDNLDQSLSVRASKNTEEHEQEAIVGWVRECNRARR